MSLSPVRIFLALCLALAACLVPLPGAAGPVDYTVDIPPLPDDLSPLLASVSDCVGLQNNPPDSPGLLRKRMRGDIQSFARALDSRGYFQASIEGELDTQVRPATVRFRIDPGRRFVFATPALVLRPADPVAANLISDTLMGLQPGAGYSSGTVLDVETAILERLKEHGYPSPPLASRDVAADHASREVHVTYVIELGAPAAFGETEISGLETVSESFVTPELEWVRGAPFDRRQIDRTRENLIRTGLFRSVRIDPDHRPDSDTVTMRVSLLEAPQRTVRPGLWHYSDLGLGAGLGWTHRNVFGAGQELRLDTSVSENLQQAGSELILPNMGRPGQSLGLTARFKNELTEVYDSSNLILSGMVRRPVSVFEIGYGLGYRLSRVDDDETRTFNLVSTPLIAEFSNADNPLEPTSGLTLAARVEPFASVEDRGSSFVFWDVSGRHSLPLLKDRSLILATRGRYSLLAGTGRESIPEDMLLYAGGGGSIRGYAYQYAGPLDEDDEPQGGVSAVDFSAELRWRINRDYGIVLFGDGGGAFSGRSPAESEQYFWGTGAGLRYYTPIGPIRLDAAVPLDPRNGIDDPFQLYLSLGQAF
jgi:translocation and assembly module TamA